MVRSRHSGRRSTEGVAEDESATLLGAQNREYLEQDAEEPAGQSQARIAGNLDGRTPGRPPRPHSMRSSKPTAQKYEKAVECLTKDRDRTPSFAF